MTATTSKFKLFSRQVFRHAEANLSASNNSNACSGPIVIEGKEKDNGNDDDVFGDLETELEAIDIGTSSAVPGQRNLSESLVPHTITEEDEHEPAEDPANWQKVKKKEKRKTVGPVPVNRFPGSTLTVPNWRDRNDVGVQGSRYGGPRTACGPSYISNGGPAYANGP